MFDTTHVLVAKRDRRFAMAVLIASFLLIPIACALLNEAAGNLEALIREVLDRIARMIG